MEMLGAWELDGRILAGGFPRRKNRDLDNGGRFYRGDRRVAKRTVFLGIGEMPRKGPAEHNLHDRARA